MKEIYCKEIDEKAFEEKLDNGLEVIIIPKKNIRKKYVIYGTHFGSIDNRFIMPNTKEEVFIPDGVAHFLEHKMFEQPDGTDSLYTLMALGIDANAYTTTDHTVFLFECTNHFYEGLDELMNYVQHPYFTDKNVEKEKGIIGQEIMMYNDDPGWQLYVNAMDCLYKENPIKIDIAGSIESISKISPDVLYKCYNTFYNPSNMVFVACGDFEPDKLLGEVKSRLINQNNQREIKRIYPKSEFSINKKISEKEMQISMPIFLIGYKDRIIQNKVEVVRRHIAIEILLNMLVGESSKFYSYLYESGDLLIPLDFDYEFSSEYAHVLISGRANNPQKIQKKLMESLKYAKENSFIEEDFIRTKKKIYGNYVREYNDVSNIGRMFIADWMKGISSFDYINEFKNVSIKYAKMILEEVFNEENSIISIIKGKND